MAADAGPGFRLLGWSGACVGGSHQDCGHVSGGGRRLASSDRLQSTVALCRCPCHAACPLADRRPVSLTVWQQVCKCPGGEPFRSWKEDPDDPWPGSQEYREQQERQSRERSEARKQAFQAARDAAPGKSRDEIRDLYIAELRARGQEVPPGPLIEAWVDLLTGHPMRGLRKIWKVHNPFADL